MIKTKNSKRKKINKWAIIAVVLILGITVWMFFRAITQVPEYAQLSLTDEEYTDTDHVIKAAALSYFIYGCENSSIFEGTVSEMIEREPMGILIENFGIARNNSEDSKTAMFDTSELIRSVIGNDRCLCCLKDEKSSFCGAAFCDDTEKCIWIVYAGAITWPDFLACGGLVVAPGFTSQEKSAFELFDIVLQSDEVKTKSYNICLTGHSLGGALATEVSLASGYPAVTINGADGLAYDKIFHISGRKPRESQIHNYVTIPDKKLTLMENVQRLMFLGSKTGVTTHLFEKNGYTSDTHCAFSFLSFTDESLMQPGLPDEVR